MVKTTYHQAINPLFSFDRPQTGGQGWNGRLSANINGGGERNRTDDLLLAKQALSQLSYTPAARRSAPVDKLVGLGRLELPTSRLSGVRSNQLSYRPSSELRIPDWWRLNRRPGRIDGKRDEGGGPLYCLMTEHKGNALSFRSLERR